MKKCLRWIMGVLFVLAVSIFLLILALPVLITPNDYKTLITDLVREKTGRELAIPGDIHLQISPGLNVTCTLGKARLADKTLFSNNTFIESEQTKIEVSLWPFLLQRRLYLTGIMMDGVTLHLLRNKEGLNNWENLAKQPETAKEATKETTGVESNQKQQALVNVLLDVTGVNLDKLQLSHINVRYDNRQTDRVLILKDLTIKTGRIRKEGQFPFEAGFNFTLDNKATNKPAIIRSGDIAMQGNATLFLQEYRLLLEDLRMEGMVKGQGLPKRGLKVIFSTNSDIDLQQQKITIKDFALSHDDAILQGSGTLEDFSSPRFNLALKIPECSPQSILKQLKTDLPILQDGDAFTHLSASLLVKGDTELTEVSDLTVMVDDTTATGTIKVKDIQTPAYEAIIHINRLDLDRYAPKKPAALPKTGEGQTASAADGEQIKTSPPIIPVTFLKALLLQLDLQLDSLKAGGAELSQVQMKIAGKDGVLQLAPLTAHVYGGSMKLEARIDVTGDVPQIRGKQKISKVQLGPLFHDMTGNEEMTGTAVIEADITTSGLDRAGLLSHMNGTMRFQCLNGEIKPIKILQVIQTARALYREETTPPVTADGATKFVRLTGTGIVADGILHNDDLMAASELMEITGAGEIDLARQQIDFMLKVVLFPNLAQDEDMGLTELGGRLISYKIVGPFTDLNQGADVEKILKAEPKKQDLTELPKEADTEGLIQEKKGADTSPEQKTEGTTGD